MNGSTQAQPNRAVSLLKVLLGVWIPLEGAWMTQQLHHQKAHLIMCDDSQRLPALNSVRDSQATWLVVEHALLSHGLLLWRNFVNYVSFRNFLGFVSFLHKSRVLWAYSSSTEQVNTEEIIIQLSTFLNLFSLLMLPGKKLQLWSSFLLLKVVIKMNLLIRIFY